MEGEKEQNPDPYGSVPFELREQPQWVNWRQEKDLKVPVNPATRGNAGVAWPNTWTTFEDAVRVGTLHGLGVGFVLTEEDPYTCVDLDNCVGPHGETTSTAREILNLLAGWVELSPSGRGIHIWVRNQVPLNKRTKGIEIYSFSRWMTITGRSNPQAPLEIPERTAQIQDLLTLYFSVEQQGFENQAFSLGDDEIWKRLFSSKNGAFFQALFVGDTSVCYDDHSRAVILLANQLAFMTKGDAARIKDLMYQTGLVREKWEERRGSTTWIDYQIQDAIRYVSRRRG